MSEPIVTQRLAIVPTTQCTLHCKLCIDFLSGPVKRRHIPIEDVCRDVDACFALIDHVGWLQFVGGEVFIYPEFAKLLNYAQKYRDRFDRVIIESNGTVFPKEDVQQAILSYGKDISIFISDYGELSKASGQFAAFAAQHDFEFKMKGYQGEDQWCGGWIDNTNPHDLHEPDDVLEVNAKNCPQVRTQNMQCYNGRLFRCAESCFMQEQEGLLPPPSPQKMDFVDLRDDSVSLEEKREILRDFYKYARRSCHYCKFKYADILPRYPAAEQI